MAWIDNTGLYRKYGTEKAVPTTAGEYCTYGSLREVLVRINLSTLPANPATQILGDTTLMPKMRMEEVEVVIITPATGGSVFNLGLIREDRTTAYDPTAFLAAIPAASLQAAAGTKVTYRIGVTGVGTAIGTTLANPGHILASLAGAAPTAGTGIIEVRIRYMAI